MVMSVLAGCSSSDSESSDTTAGSTETTAAAGGETKTITVGFTTSQTGKYNESSTRQVDGFTLWMDQVNAAGGIKLDDGTTYMIESKTYDDESSSDRVQELYTDLATKDNADFLISPYSSGLTAAAAVVSEQYGKVMITTGAASDATYQQGFTKVYQIYTPASRYLTSSIDLLGSLDSSAKKIAFVYENSKFSTGVVEAAKAYAEENGYEVVMFEGYDPETTDFNPFINKIEAAGPDAVLGGGHFQDGSTLAKQLYEKNIPVKFIALLVAPPEPKFAELGDAAKDVAGPSQWEPLVQYTDDSAKKLGMDWFGTTGDEFTAAYTEAFGDAPSYHSGGGYAAGLVLQHAIETAQSIDPDAVATALDATNIVTFFGPLKFDTTAESHGLQIGHDMVVIQWQPGTADPLEKQIVWPEAAQTATPLYPRG
jgi:branched-chain amino acid transport system substrate-binding protein